MGWRRLFRRRLFRRKQRENWFLLLGCFWGGAILRGWFWIPVFDFWGFEIFNVWQWGYWSVWKELKHLTFFSDFWEFLRLVHFWALYIKGGGVKAGPFVWEKLFIFLARRRFLRFSDNFLMFWVEVQRFKVKGSWLAHIFPNQDSLGFNLWKHIWFDFWWCDFWIDVVRKENVKVNQVCQQWKLNNREREWRGVKLCHSLALKLFPIHGNPIYWTITSSQHSIRVLGFKFWF